MHSVSVSLARWHLIAVLTVFWCGGIFEMMSSQLRWWWPYGTRSVLNRGWSITVHSKFTIVSVVHTLGYVTLSWKSIVSGTYLCDEFVGSCVLLFSLGPTVICNYRALFLVHRFLSPWWRRRWVPPKRRFLQESHGVTSQKTPFFIVTAMKTSNLTWMFLYSREVANPCHKTTIQTCDTRWCQRKVTRKYEVKNCDGKAQSGTVIQIELIIYGTELSNNPSPHSSV
jgi:hypothetical protein